MDTNLTWLPSRDFFEVASILRTQELISCIKNARKVLQNLQVKKITEPTRLWIDKSQKVYFLWTLNEYVNILQEELARRVSKDIKIFDGVLRRIRHQDIMRLFETFNNTLKTFPTLGPQKFIEWPPSVYKTHQLGLLAIDHAHYSIHFRRAMSPWDIVEYMHPEIIGELKVNEIKGIYE